MFLLDTGVVFAAVYQSHVHHKSVSKWLASARAFATCGLTQIGAFRLLLTDAAMRGSPLNPELAHEVIAELVHGEQHFLLPCPSISPGYVGRTTGHKAAFDDYLIQIADAAGARLVTLDQSLVNRWPSHTLLIE